LKKIHFLKTTHLAGYTKSDIQLIQDSAKKYQLEIIPLIQTFGHLEWILKLNEFRFYRDNRNLPTVISPCLNSTYILLEGTFQLFFFSRRFFFLKLFRSFTTNTRSSSE
jgi:hypothetical protein